MRLSAFAILVIHVALSSENNTKFKSVNEKSEIWDCFQNSEKAILDQLTTALQSDKAYEVLQKEISEQLEDFHQEDEHLGIFLDHIANKNSIALTQVFNDNFRYNKQIATEQLEYKAIAFKAVEMHYLTTLRPILKKHKVNMNPAGRLILDFLSDHRGFGPAFEIAYIPPSIYHSRKKLEVEFDALRTEARSKNMLPWLAHRYLRSDFGAKLSKTVENIKCTESDITMITSFSKDDPKYIENLRLIQIFHTGNDADKVFENVVKQELKSLFQNLGFEVGNVFVSSPSFFSIRYKEQK